MKIETYITTQLNEGEDVLAIIHRHPILLIPSVATATALVLVDFFFLAWLFAHGRFGVLGFFVVLGIAALIGIRGVHLWRMNVVALTSNRVIDIDQRGLFERHVAEAPLDKVQDVRYIIRGLWATMFSFGTVIVQTAGNGVTIEADGIHRPVQFQRLITDAQRTATARPTAPPTNRIVDIKQVTKR